MDTPGQLIRTARDAHGWTVDELAAAVGVHVRSVKRWEADEHTPSRPVTRRLAETLEMDRTVLLEAIDEASADAADPGSTSDVDDLRVQVNGLHETVERLTRVVELLSAEVRAVVSGQESTRRHT